jgi:predicted TIM-barrel fold metal-dependent hydrolase
LFQTKKDKKMKIIDAHAHLWLRQEAEVNGLKIKTLDRGRSLFMGEIRQMLPPFMIDGCNSAEIFLSNMDYAQVSGAVITQEYIDGMQNEYLWEVQQKYPNRLLCCGLIDARQPGYSHPAGQLIAQGFQGLKIPAERLLLPDRRVWLTDREMMETLRQMEARDVFLSVDLAPGETQVAEMEEIIQEFPRLRIAIGHFGMANRPRWQAQIRLARYPNVYIESGGITWLFHNEFYPFPGAVQAIREAIALVGAEKLMWGSDYPRTIVAITYRMSFDFILKSNSLTDAEKQSFLGGNAQNFYRLNPEIDLPYIRNMSE